MTGNMPYPTDWPYTVLWFLWYVGVVFYLVEGLEASWVATLVIFFGTHIVGVYSTRYEYRWAQHKREERRRGGPYRTRH